MDFKCTLPPVNNGGELACQLPQQGVSAAVIVSVIIGAASIAVAILSARTAHLARKAAKDARGEDLAVRVKDREHAKDRALLELYQFVTTDVIRAARSKLWTKKGQIESRKRRSLTREDIDAYFDLIWSMDYLYETLLAHGISDDRASKTLGLHIAQIQQHIARVHRAQGKAGALGIDNERVWANYASNRHRWDESYPGLAKTSPDAPKTVDRDPALAKASSST